LSPFKVFRSKNGNLPVYRDYKFRRAKVTTILRRFTGNVDELKSELKKVVEPAVVEEKVGKIVIHGDKFVPVKQWLRGLGF